MSLTLDNLKSEIAASADYKIEQKEWLKKIEARGITKYSQPDFDNLIPMYLKKIDGIRARLRTEGVDIKVVPVTEDGRFKTSEEIVNEMNKQMETCQYLYDKEKRLLDKLAICLKEVEYRKNGVVERKDLHLSADYHIDYAHGNDARTGLKSATLTIDSTADTTHITDAALTGADDYINGAFVWNITRNAGAYVSDFDAASDTIVLDGAIAGMTAGDEYYYIDAWKTINKYTTTTVRTAGDRAFLRANTTWNQGTEAVDITFDEDGSIDAYISIIGCDATINDPWNDDSNVKPIIDFQDAAFQFVIDTDDGWWIERLDMRQSADTFGIFRSSACYFVHFKDCVFRDSGNSSTEGLYVTGFVTLDGCTFENCWTTALAIGGGCIAKNCVFNAGTDVSTDYFVQVSNSWAFFDSCSFGAITAADKGDIHNSFGSMVWTRNCTGTKGQTYNAPGYTYNEDFQGTFENHTARTTQGDISRQTASPRSGGSDSYVKMLPTSACGLVASLILGDLKFGFSPVLATADVEKTITVYARVGSAWDTPLAANEAYLKASYLDSDSDCGRTEINSTETITNDGEWTAFTVTFTPQRTGLVYLWFYLAEYEDASEYIDVDDEPVVS